MSIRRAFFSGVVWSSAADIGQRAFSFLILLMLVRLLTPQEFGTAATALMIIQLLQPVTRFGLYDYLIFRQDADEPTKGAAWLTGIALGLVSSLLLFAVAGLVADAFSDPALAPVLRALSPIFLLRSISCVHEAMLVKQFGFKTLALRTVSAVFIAGVVAIVLAYAGWGVYSLVIQQLVNALVATVVLCFSYRWLPRFADVRAKLRTVAAAGSKYTIAQLFSSLNSTVYGLAIGLFVGTEAAGVFRLAWTGLDLCIQLTIRPFMQVAQPLFSQIQWDRKRLGEVFIKVCQHCAVLTFPIFGWMAVMGPEVGTFAYGARWADAGEVLSIICFVVFPATPNYLIAVLLNAVGQPGRVLVLSAAQSVLSVLFAMIAVRWGMVGIAVAFVLRTLITTPLGFAFLKRSAEVSVHDIGRALAMPVIASALMMLSVVGTKYLIPQFHAVVIALVVSGIVGAVVYGVTMFKLDRDMITTMVSMLRQKAKRAS